MSKAINRVEAPTHYELAKGYLFCRDNSYRLIREAEYLFSNGFFLSTINHCRLANEEIAKSILIWNASSYLDSENGKWNWFYKSLTDHKEKLRVLEYSVHWDDYKDQEIFSKIISDLMRTREETLYVGFDKQAGSFKYPDEYFESPEETSKIELEYSNKLHKLVFLGEYLTGNSSIEQIVDAFNIDVRE